VSAEEHVAAATYLLASLTGLLALVTAVSAGFLWAQLRAARRDAAEIAARERRQATMQFFADTLDIRRTMPLDLPEDRDTEGIARLLGEVRGGSPEARHRRSLLNEYLAWWELTATSIHDDVGVFDPRLLELFASGRLGAVWTNYRPFILEQRAEYGDPTLYDQLEAVAVRWGVAPPPDAAQEPVAVPAVGASTAPPNRLSRSP
jgi:hypothetical protein